MNTRWQHPYFLGAWLWSYEHEVATSMLPRCMALDYCMNTRWQHQYKCNIHWSGLPQRPLANSMKHLYVLPSESCLHDVVFINNARTTPRQHNRWHMIGWIVRVIVDGFEAASSVMAKGEVMKTTSIPCQISCLFLTTSWQNTTILIQWVWDMPHLSKKWLHMSHAPSIW